MFSLWGWNHFQTQIFFEFKFRNNTPLLGFEFFFSSYTSEIFFGFVEGANLSRRRKYDENRRPSPPRELIRGLASRADTRKKLDDPRQFFDCRGARALRRSNTSRPTIFLFKSAPAFCLFFIFFSLLLFFSLKCWKMQCRSRGEIIFEWSVEKKERKKKFFFENFVSVRNLEMKRKK